MKRKTLRDFGFREPTEHEREEAAYWTAVNVEAGEPTPKAWEGAYFTVIPGVLTYGEEASGEILLFDEHLSNELVQNLVKNGYQDLFTFMG